MEIFNEIWAWIVVAFGSVSITSIIATIIGVCFKAAFNRTVSKINVEQIANDATNKGIETVKKISFEQSIQPLVESELMKITETANKYSKEAFVEVQKKYDMLILVLEKFCAYFDDSMVSDAKKLELKQAILDAKTEPNKVQTIVIEETIPQEIKEAVEEVVENKTDSLHKASNVVR